MLSLSKLILWYLKTNIPVDNSADHYKFEFNLNQNLIKFMTSVYNMIPKEQGGYNTGRYQSITNYDIAGFNGLVHPNKAFFKASAILLEYSN